MNSSSMDPSLRRFLVAGTLTSKHQSTSSNNSSSSFASSAVAAASLQKPSNYVPGAGRGAIGFTTASDIGPALNPTDLLTAAVSGRDGSSSNFVCPPISNRGEKDLDQGASGFPV